MEKRRINFDSLSEKRICTYLKNKDEQAFVFVYDKYQQGLHNFILNRSRDTHLAEEICQQAWIKVWKKIDSFQGKSSLKTWIHRVALNCLWDFYKKNHRIVDIEDIGGERVFENLLGNQADLKTPFNLASSTEEAKKIKDKVSQIISRLPEEKSKLINLIFIKELTYQEAAKEMSIPVGTVMSRVFYLRKFLQEELKKTRRIVKNELAP
jgi:RNA polymerase sigma-70 factor (ECF subfamily)